MRAVASESDRQNRQVRKKAVKPRVRHSNYVSRGLISSRAIIVPANSDRVDCVEGFKSYAVRQVRVSPGSTRVPMQLDRRCAGLFIGALALYNRHSIRLRDRRL